MNRDEKGKLSWGAASPDETVTFMLAQTEDVPITKSWKLPQLPPSFDPSEFTVTEPTNEAVRRWKINRFEGGEGAPIWDATSDEYNKSDRVQPARDGRGGLELGASVENPTTIVTSGADLTDVLAIGVGPDHIVALGQSLYREWSQADGQWAPQAGYTHGMGSSPKTRPVYAGTHIYAGYFAGDIYRFNSGGAALWVDFSAVYTGEVATFAYPIAYRGSLYAQVGANLYLVDQSTADTVTKVGDIEAGVLNSALINNSICVGPVGPVWYTASSDEAGRTHIWQHNVATSTTEPLSFTDIPLGALPCDIAYHGGFVFVAFKQAETYNASGDLGKAYLYYQRGQQRGVIGPLPRPDGDTDDLPSIAGLAGDQLIISYAGHIWGYDFSSGGISMIAKFAGAETNTGLAVAWGREIFAQDAPIGGGTSNVQRFNLEEYSTDSGDHYLDTGRFDLGWAGMDKVLIDITVTTDPLPANTSVRVAYSVDGGAFATHADTSSTDDDTVHTFTVSTPAAAVVGESFEVRVILDTTDASASPRVWEIMARGAIDELEFAYELQIDLGHRDDNDVSEAKTLADLETLAAVPGYVNFEHSWQVAEHTDPTVEVVKVVAIGKPEIPEGDGLPFCTLRLKGRDVA